MSGSDQKIHDSILQTIGNTPMVRLPNIAQKYGLKADLVAKLEFFNPLASVKDRTVLAMFEAAEKDGKIQPGNTVIIEASAGNAAISMAAIAAAKNYQLCLTMPENVPYERRKIVEHYGAEVFLTPSDRGMRGALEKVDELMAQHGDKAYRFQQFENPAAVHTHAHNTAREIWTDCEGKLDYVVAGVGTGSTLVGLSKALKAQNADLKVVAVEPEASAVLSGADPAQHKIEGIGVGFVPPQMEDGAYDAVAKISSDKAFEMARLAAKLDGIPCGISSGAALAAAIDLAQKSECEGKRIVVIFPSFAERYLSTDLFENPQTMG